MTMFNLEKFKWDPSSFFLIWALYEKYKKFADIQIGMGDFQIRA